MMTLEERPLSLLRTSAHWSQQLMNTDEHVRLWILSENNEAFPHFSSYDQCIMPSPVKHT